MDKRQLIGTAFEYASISNSSARISNDISNLMELLGAYDASASEMKLLNDARLLLLKYHYSFTSTVLYQKTNQQ